MKSFLRSEVLIAFLLALLILTIYVLSVDDAPQWIYQGF